VQLDNTRITIRERSLLETLDLSFRLLREFWKPWLICALIAIIPLGLLNALLLNWLALEIDYDEYNILDPETWSGDIFPFRYFWTMAVFIYVEAQLASIFVVAYLGPAVFMENPRIKQVVLETLKQTPTIILCQLLLRGVLPMWLLILTFDRYEPNYWVEVGLILFLMLPILTGIRVFRPFINEIVLLEKNPLRAKNPQVITVGKRSSLLHSPHNPDLFVRWLGTVLATLILIWILGVTSFLLQGVMFGSFYLNAVLVYVWYPALLWTVVGLISVVRFLDYLDLRIRHEGWEVELLMKAEALRLKPQLN
jgi:hypothetical protein